MSNNTMSNKQYTYDEIAREFGEEIGLRYDELVCAMVMGEGIEDGILGLIDSCRYIGQASGLIRRARKHAEQEIKNNRGRE